MGGLKIGPYVVRFNGPADYIMLLLIIGVIIGIPIAGASYAAPFIADVLDSSPEAEITSSSPEYEERVGAPVEINASESSAPDDEELLYSFDLTGDGEFEFEALDEPAVNHRFEEEGEHEVMVEVMTVDGVSDTANTTVKIDELAELENLTATQEKQSINTSFNSTSELELIDVLIEGEDTETEFSESDVNGSAESGYTIDYEPGETGTYEITVDGGVDADTSVDEAKSTNVTFDGTSPVLRNGTAVNSTNLSFVVEDEMSEVDGETVTNDTFDIDDGEFTDISPSTPENSSEILMTAELNEPIQAENTTISVAEDEYIADIHGNQLTSEDDNASTVTIEDVDGVPPQVTNVSVVDNKTIDINITEKGSGLDIPDDPENLFSLSNATISNASFVSTNEVNTLQLELNESLDAEEKTLTLEETLQDEAGNEKSDYNKTLDDVDKTPPQIHNATTNDENDIVSVELTDMGTGLDNSTVSTESFSVTDSEINNTSTETLNQTHSVVEIELDEEIRTTTANLTVTEEGVSDEAGNRLSNTTTPINVSGTGVPEVEDFMLESRFDLAFETVLYTDRPAENLTVELDSGVTLERDDFTETEEDDLYKYTAYSMSPSYGIVEGDVTNVGDGFGNDDNPEVTHEIEISPSWQMRASSKNQSGVTTESPPTSPPEEDWRVLDVSDATIASPVVAEEYVFATTSLGDLLMVDKNSGEDEWVAPIDGEIETSPSVRGQNVFVSTTDGVLANVDPETGDVQWREETNYGELSDPVPIEDDVLVTSSSRTLQAFDAETGDQSWNYSGDSATTPPAVSEDTVIIGTETGVVAVDIDTEFEDWEMAYDSEAKDVAIHDETVVVLLEDEIHALTVDGEELWSVELDGFAASEVSLDSDTIFASSDDGSLAAFEVDDGEQAWDRDLTDDFGGSEESVSNPTVTDNSVIVTYGDDVIASFAPGNGAMQWDIDSDGVRESDPVVTDGSVFVGTDSGELKRYSP